MMLQPPRMNTAFEVSHVIHDLGPTNGAILIDMVGVVLRDGDGVFRELAAAGWRDVASPKAPADPHVEPLRGHRPLICRSSYPNHRTTHRLDVISPMVRTIRPGSSWRGITAVWPGSAAACSDRPVLASTPSTGTRGCCTSSACRA
jgi:hypothetical protein